MLFPLSLDVMLVSPNFNHLQPSHIQPAAVCHLPLGYTAAVEALLSLCCPGGMNKALLSYLTVDSPLQVW